MPIKLPIKVISNSSQDQIVGWIGSRLKIKVRAQAEKGGANQAVIELLARKLTIDKAELKISTGHTNSCKVVIITGHSETQIRSNIALLIS